MTDLCLCGEFGDTEPLLPTLEEGASQAILRAFGFWLMKVAASTFQVYWKPGD